MVRPENEGGQPGHELTNPLSSVAVRSGQTTSTAACGGTASAITSQDAEFCSQLARQLHDLKNLLWPITVHAECVPSEATSSALAELIERIGRDAQEALTIATQMSEFVDRHSKNGASPATEQGTVAARSLPRGPVSRMRILCVVDDANVRGTLARLLKHLGHDVDLSCSGSEALLTFASHPYDLVMTDTHLADMSGRDITRNIRAHGSTPVIWLSELDLAVTGMIADAPDSPSDILTKPLSLGALRKSLDKVAAAASSAAP